MKNIGVKKHNTDQLTTAKIRIELLVTEFDSRVLFYTKCKPGPWRYRRNCCDTERLKCVEADMVKR